MSGEEWIDWASAVSMLIVGLGLTAEKGSAVIAESKLVSLGAEGAVHARYRGRPLHPSFWGLPANDLTIDGAEPAKRWEARKAELLAAGVPADELARVIVPPRPDWRPRVRFNADHLRRWIESEHPVVTASTAIVAAQPRGPQPAKRERTIQRMLAALDAKATTIDALKSEKEEALASTYGVSRDTARKARAAVLAGRVAAATKPPEFVEVKTPTNDK